ncbi:MAG: hypothetical protein KF898_08895 [Parachlamydiales bacterium]|jgi:hypothetical protein|nr:hypothetical protein [Verrucomicrobiota bacterium]MBX3719748.1 hypothetical protein [Candidatus Acheromyda pituitae]
MSYAVEQQPTSCASQVATLAFQTGAEAAIGALAAAAFTTINPVAGAIFGATAGMTGGITSIIFDQTGLTENWGLAGKVARIGLGVILGSLAGYAVATAAGFPITFAAAAILTAASLATAVAGVLVVGSCLCFTVCCVAAIGAIAASRENLEPERNAEHQHQMV